MIYTKKYRYKPIYKKFLGLRKNVQNRQKLIKFKKRKWSRLLFVLKRQSKRRKYNCYYKFYNQSTHHVFKFNKYFSKNYKKNLITKKTFNLFYGSLKKKYLKLLALKSVHKSNQIKNKINSTKFFNTYLEKRLDVVLLRSHFVLSIKNARQLINHGHVFVNNLMVKDPGFCIKKGDIINISKKTHKILRYYLGHSPVWPLPPLYLQISYALFQILVVEDIFVSNNSIKFFTWLNLNNVIHLYKK